MRSRHELLVVAVAVGGVLGGTRLLSAQEAPPAPPESAPPAAASVEAAKPAEDASASATATSTEANAEVDVATETSEEKAATTPSKAVGATPGRFEPTEKVRADFDVSFPIDI